jgi:hypothetical protein
MLRISAVVLIGCVVVANCCAWMFVLIKQHSVIAIMTFASFMSGFTVYELTKQGQRLSLDLPDSENCIRFAASTDLVANGDECIICLQPYVLAEQCRLLPCGHIYHERCISAWGKCPLKCSDSAAAGNHCPAASTQQPAVAATTTAAAI